VGRSAGCRGRCAVRPLLVLGPGMVKSALTLRTGNAWVHAIAYHAIAPLVTLDIPNIVRILGIR